MELYKKVHRLYTKGKEKVKVDRENTKRRSLPHLNPIPSAKSNKGIVLSTMHILTQNDELLTKELFND